MASDSRIIKYIQDTTSAGYQEDQVKEALLKQGWYQDEIDQAYAEIKGEPPVEKEGVTVRKQGDTAKPDEAEEAEHYVSNQVSAGFVLAIIGGIIIILNSVMVFMDIGDLLHLFMNNVDFSLLGMFDLVLSEIDMLLINVIIGGFLIGVSFIIYSMPDKSKITGAFIVALSIISVLVGNGFLIGGMVAIVAGLLAILGK